MDEGRGWKGREGFNVRLYVMWETYGIPAYGNKVPNLGSSFTKESVMVGTCAK